MVLKLTHESPVILIGSSMGCWLAMLAALKNPKKIVGLIALAPAPDFTEESIWQKLPQTLQEQMQRDGAIEISGYCQEKYLISYQLITEAKNHLLLNKPAIELSCPVHLIHGMLDRDIPYTLSTRLAQKITSQNVVIKLIKDGDHRLSRPSDLRIISNSLAEVYGALF
jgi:pimeloyl-ACP methyl ester carboxylesterase